MTENKQTIILALIVIYVIATTILIVDLLDEREMKREFIAKCDINFNQSTLVKECVVRVVM